MDALNAAFVGAGGLAFDVGAHVGDRTASFLRLGARVVALEPQPAVFRALRLIHGREPRAVLRREAVGARAGEIGMRVNSANPTVSTASGAFVAAAASADGWSGEVWDRTIRVPVTTLDALMAEHGRPDFVKIDVEGHELEVLRGLSAPVPALSFEFTMIQRDLAFACLDRLGELGRFEFNVSLGEEHWLLHGTWIGASELRDGIAGLPDMANSGDVYARRVF
jgi:FkbM family methyltransferase